MAVKTGERAHRISLCAGMILSPTPIVTSLRCWLNNNDDITSCINFVLCVHVNTVMATSLDRDEYEQLIREEYTVCRLALGNVRSTHFEMSYGPQYPTDFASTLQRRYAHRTRYTQTRYHSRSFRVSTINPFFKAWISGQRLRENLQPQKAVTKKT